MKAKTEIGQLLAGKTYFTVLAIGNFSFKRTTGISPVLYFSATSVLAFIVFLILRRFRERQFMKKPGPPYLWAICGVIFVSGSFLYFL
ncbi:hypothetical protein [Neobacillus sp. LXY-4]|uniref:hypothetical protein n=1 Tax=Neobacillus sp. LXY-4 TaxID=3379826 RepID=UPI003EE091A0